MFYLMGNGFESKPGLTVTFGRLIPRRSVGGQLGGLLGLLAVVGYGASTLGVPGSGAVVVLLSMLFALGLGLRYGPVVDQ